MEYKKGDYIMSNKKGGVRNTLGDLNNILFAQLERLDNEDLTGDELLQEIARSKAISEISKNVIENANTVLQAKKYANELISADDSMPRMLEG